MTPAAPAAPPAPAAATPAELDIKFPDGANIDKGVLDAFKSVAKEHGLSSKAAQALVDFQLKQNAAAEKSWTETRDKSRVADFEKIKADPKYGGPVFEKTKADALSAMQQFFGEKVSKAFAQLGLDSMPEIVIGLANIRAAIKEDGTRPPNANPAPGKPRPMSQTQKVAQRYNKKSSQQR